MSNSLSNTVVSLVVQFGTIGVADSYVPQIIPNNVLGGIDCLKKQPIALYAMDNGR